MLLVITPVHKLKFLNNAYDNFYRQTYKKKHLLLILNGELSNYYPIAKSPSITCVHSESKNIAELRNIGLDFLEKYGYNSYSMFDSDDYYGPDYLKIVTKKLEEGYDIVGASDFYFKNGKKFYSIENQVTANKCVHGPTITGIKTKRRFNLKFHNLAEDIEYVLGFPPEKLGLIKLTNSWVYNVQPDSIQARSFESFLESLKFSNTVRQAESCVIKCGEDIIWKYGDGWDIKKIFT